MLSIRRSFILILLIFHAYVYGQGNGVQFDNKLSWAQIKEKAKREDKYIFVDCFATWCGPCKAMEKEVYILDSVGKIINKSFISVKLQMDQTSGDDEYTKSWYSISKNFQSLYDIASFPCYLFFSPDGKLVHRDLGLMSPTEFLNLSRDAQNPQKQYYTLLQKYNAGKMRSKSEIASLIKMGQINGNIKNAKEIAIKFKKEYLDGLSIPELCTKENLVFIESFPSLVSSHDNYFKMFFSFPEKCDSINPGLADLVVRNVIQREEIDPQIRSVNSSINSSPNWDSIRSNIKEKYGEKYSEMLIMPAKKRYAFKTRNWNDYVTIQNYEINTKISNPEVNLSQFSWDLNMFAWNTYLVCNDTTILKMTLPWINLSINLVKDRIPNASEQLYDTKARILYKIGRISDAIEYEQKAIDFGIQMAKRSGGSKGVFFDDFTLVLERMKKGESINDLN